MWEEDWMNVAGHGFFALCLVALLICFWALYKEGQKWEMFKAEHNCRVVAKVSGEMFTGVAPVVGGEGGVGIIISSTPSKTGWLCDDGVTYYR